MSLSKLSDLSVAVVGGGIAGAAAALMLGRLGARVTLFEQVPEPRAVGAGILLQPTGLAVLRAIDEGIEAELEGARIVQLLGHTPSGRVVLDSQYRFWREGSYGLGIHRGALFDALWRRLRGLPNVTVRTGVTVVRVEQSELGTVLFDGEDNFSKYDVVVLAEGVNSKLRGQLNIPYSAKPYPWGAFYAILPSVASLPQDVLLQRYEVARKMTGVLPMGLFGGQAMSSLFWSAPVEALSVKPSIDEFKRNVLAIWPQLDEFLKPLVDAEQLAAARYADVVMPHWHDNRVVLIGDAAHAMSPQLGQGANMGLMDAYELVRQLMSQPSVPDALSQYSTARKHHLRYYQWASRWLTPLFQSHRTAAPWLRDRLMNSGNRLPMVRRFGADTLVGVKQGWLRANMDLGEIDSLW